MYLAIRPFLFQDHLQKENTFVISLLTGKKSIFACRTSFQYFIAWHWLKSLKEFFLLEKNASLVIKAFSNQHSDLENKVDYSCDKMI